MSPELYFAVMLITNPQKAKRILIANDWENWFMDLFDEEYDDVLSGRFIAKQDEYIDRIIDKFLETAKVKITDTDEYAREVIDKAVRTATQIQETTKLHLTMPLYRRKDELNIMSSGQTTKVTKAREETLEVADLIRLGIGFSALKFSTDAILPWLSNERANTIALNESNWICNHEEFFDAKSKYKRKTWHTALDERVRMTHIALEGVTIGIDEIFHVGSSLMRFPLDSSLGASASEIINCRCTVEYKV